MIQFGTRGEENNMASDKLKHMSPNERFYQRIKKPFVETVNPRHLLPYLSLSIPDEEEVEACQDTKGQTNAAAILLRKLYYYPGWIDGLIKVLKYKEVGLTHLADECEKCKSEILAVIEVTGDVDMRPGVESMEIDTEDPQVETQIKLAEFFQTVLNNLTQEEQFSQILYHLNQISKMICVEAQPGCIELLLRLDNLNDLYVFQEYYKGGALQDALEKDILTPEQTYKIKTAAENFGLKIKSLNICLSIKEEEIENCFRHLKDKESTPRKTFLEALLYPLQDDTKRHREILESQHLWPPVYQELWKKTIDPQKIEQRMVNCSEIADLIQFVLDFMENKFVLNDTLLEDMKNIWLALVCSIENEKQIVIISDYYGLSKIFFEENVAMEFYTKYGLTLESRLQNSVQDLVKNGILRQVSETEDGYEFSSILLRDFVAYKVCSSLGKLIGSYYDGFRYILHTYTFLSVTSQKDDMIAPFLSKLDSLQQLNLVGLAISWDKLHSDNRGMEFVENVLKFEILDLCDNSVVKNMKYFRKPLKMLHSFQVKVCLPDLSGSLAHVVNELINKTSRESITIPAEVSSLCVEKFEVILKVLTVLDFHPSIREDKENKNNFLTDQGLFLEQISNTVDMNQSFELIFSKISLCYDKIEKLCLFVPCMQHISRFILKETNLKRSEAEHLLSLMDPSVVKGISLSGCSLEMSSGPIGLSQFSKLEFLDLDHTNMQDAGILSLEKDLKGIHQLKELNISYNNISTVGLLQLSSFIVDSKHLLTLRLHGNSFGETGGFILGVILSRMSQLEILSVRDCNLQDIGMVHLSSSFSNQTCLKRLSVRNNNIKGSMSVEIFENLAKCQFLLFMDYSQNIIIPDREEGKSDSDMISKAVLKLLAGTHFWHHLSFWNCNISKSNIFDNPAQLKHLYQITFLCLQTNHIDDAMAKKISSCIHEFRFLQDLNLRDNSIGDIGAVSLASALINHKYLHSLWLDWNVFGYQGAEKLIELALNLPNIVDCKLANHHLAPPEKKSLLEKVGTAVVRETVHEVKRGKLTILL